MTSVTANYAFSWPDPGDPIAAGDDTIKAFAERADLVIKGGELAETWMAAQQNIAAGGNVSIGSLTVPGTYKRRGLTVALHYTPAAAVSAAITLVPNWADARITDPGYPLRQFCAASGLGQIAYWHFQVGIGAGGTTQFNLTVGAGVALNNVRARGWTY